MVRKALPIFGSLLCIAAALLLFAYSQPKVASKDEKIMVVLRQIGHQILLGSKDSSSRILPIEKIDSNSFLIRFEKPFYISNSHLVEIVERNIKNTSLPQSYLVEVVEETSKNVFYSYEYSEKISNEIACLTRDQVKGHYSIKIHFDILSGSPLAASPFLPYLVLPIAVALLITGFKGFDSKKVKKPTVTESEGEPDIKVGNFRFSEKDKTLKYGGTKIELSSKETKILGIFADNPNQVLERDMLMKEVWENEGVIVGRSLDVFISKLRKKLVADPSVKIVNIHGKGYRMEVEMESDRKED